MKRIFVSHISQESALAITIKDWIENTFPGHCEVFVSSDIHDIPAGSKWMKEISDALSESSLFLVICSPLSISRPWINYETGCAWIKDVPVIPICHSGQGRGSLPQPIAYFQALEVTSPNFIQEFMESIAKHLVLGKIPRIDQILMQKEIIAAIKSIPVAKIDPKEHEKQNGKNFDVPEELVNVLKLISDLGDKGLHPEELAAHMKVVEPKIQYYLDELMKKKLVSRRDALMGIPPYYFLTNSGREFLVKHNLL